MRKRFIFQSLWWRICHMFKRQPEAAPKYPTGTIYISGPISGKRPEDYIPVFAAVKQQIEADGHKAVNPLTDVFHPVPDDWGQCVLDDLAVIRRCDGIAMLPGWQNSNGCQVEYHWAIAHGLHVNIVRAAHPARPNSRQRRKSPKSPKQ